MRYDKIVYLLTRPLTTADDDDMYAGEKVHAKKVKANVKRTNLSLADGTMYDATIVRVYGEVEADYIGFNDYDPGNANTWHRINKVGRHFQRTDFYVVNSEVIFNAK